MRESSIEYVDFEERPTLSFYCFDHSFLVLPNEKGHEKASCAVDEATPTRVLKSTPVAESQGPIKRPIKFQHLNC